LRNILNFGIDNTVVGSKWHRKGGNYKMSDIQAVYITQYLYNVQSIKDYTESLYKYFLEKVKDEKISIQEYPNFSDGIPFVSCICIFSERSNEIITSLLANKIYSRKYYNPLIESPVSVSFYQKIVCIPCTIDMKSEDIDKIVTIISDATL